mgnify:CR=1 FL=1
MDDLTLYQTEPLEFYYNDFGIYIMDDYGNAVRIPASRWYNPEYWRVI